MAIPRCHFWDSHPNPDFPDPDVLSCIFFHAQWPIPAPWPALRPCLSAPWNRSLGKADADGEPRDSCLRDRELSPKYPTVVGSHSIMRHQIRRYLLPSLLFITLSLALPGRGLSQAAFDAVSSVKEIPHDKFKTWSLFLVCKDDWATSNKENGFELYNLYLQFENFGKAIGDDYLACGSGSVRNP